MTNGGNTCARERIDEWRETNPDQVQRRVEKVVRIGGIRLLEGGGYEVRGMMRRRGIVICDVGVA